jgi:hypothetical protein
MCKIALIRHKPIGKEAVIVGNTPEIFVSCVARLSVPDRQCDPVL